jgi:LAO/AO transport system kinase
VSQPQTTAQLLERALAGDQRAAGRLLSKVERSLVDAAEVLELVADRPRKARSVGIIGPPGAGKSSLVAVMIEQLAEQGKGVAVLANDPTGAHSGGALLGDRVRMKSLARNPRVFIRSVATRDPLRSLNSTTFGAVALLSRLDFDVVLVEAVGAGQADIGTSLVTDTTVLVSVPGLGDDVQAMKAGLMEVADIVAVNKSDLEGARETANVLRQALNAMHEGKAWVPPVVQVSAATSENVDKLLATIDAHATSDGSAPPGELVRDVVIDLVSYEVNRRLRNELPASRAMTERLAQIETAELDILRVALDLADGVLLDGVQSVG